MITKIMSNGTFHFDGLRRLDKLSDPNSNAVPVSSPRASLVSEQDLEVRPPLGSDVERVCDDLDI